MEENVLIPRNIKTKEIVAYRFNSKQVFYLLIGIGGSVAVWSLGLPLDAKMIGTVISISASLFLSLAKVHGQELDTFIKNSIAFPMRTKEWSEDNAKAPVCRIRFNIN